jgi:hypothetical protein
VKAFIGVTSGCILGIDLIKIFKKLQSVVPVVDRLINRQNPFKTEKGESVLYPVAKALLALAELVPACIIGTNCVDFLKELKFISSITDAAYNFSKVLGTGDTKEKLISLLRCFNACLLLLVKLSVDAASLWFANPAIFEVSSLSIHRRVAIFVINKASAAFFKFDEEYDFVLSAAEEIFSAAELPNRIVDPIFDPFATSMS